MSPKDTGPRLGRGLAALLGDAALPVEPGIAGIRQIPLDLLDASPFQPRGAMDQIGLEELAASIRVRGILQPLLVRPHPVTNGRFQIVAGERRWRAAALAGLHEIPALIRALDNADATAAAMVENLQRQDLNAIEEAEGYNRLLEEFGLTQELVAQAVGKSRSHVSNTLRLLNLPPPLQQALRAGTVTAGHARALLGHPEPEAALGTVLAQGLSVRQTEALAARKPRVEPAPRVKDPNTEALERDLTAELGLRVEIAAGARGGTVRIHYQDLDQLDAFLARLRGALQIAGL
ncbi:MAG TPA: ParB/RepB/Spo0J family partition protein [Acetobacteraceae bacterium]|nr:ParB/RepB/Spo0J family partition protein [Acetobacteraceae bacterium]